MIMYDSPEDGISKQRNNHRVPEIGYSITSENDFLLLNQRTIH